MSFQAPPEEVLKYLAQLDDASVADLLDRARESFGKGAATSEAHERGQSKIKLCDLGTCDCCPKQTEASSEDIPKPSAAADDGEKPPALSAAERRRAAEDLIQALQLSNLRLATHLRRRADPRHLDENGWAVLHWAVHLAGTARSSKNLTAIPESEQAPEAPQGSLLNAKDSPDEVVGCECCRPEVAPPEIRSFLREYLQGPDINVDVRNSDNATALMFAADSGDEEACEWLIQAGADLTLQDDDNDSAADWARKQGHLDLADRLSKR